MPTIDIKKKDLDTLIGRKLSVEVLEKRLMLAKAELKEYNAGTDDLKVELSDSNRPDLWCAEGVARQPLPFLAQPAELVEREAEGNVVADRANVTQVIGDALALGHDGAQEQGAFRNLHACRLFHGHAEIGRASCRERVYA